MCFSGGSPSSVPEVAPIAREPARRQATLPSTGVKKARTDERTAAQSAFLNRSGNLLTGSGGLSTTANTQKATLLGQV